MLKQDLEEDLERLRALRSSALALEIPDSELARYQKHNCVMLIEMKIAEITHILEKCS